MNVSPDKLPPLVAIVDDEPDITTFLGLALEDAGYRVVTINDSASALALLRERRPDLVCLDLLMPEQMGPSLYLQIRRIEELRGVPVLILSGLGAQDHFQELLSHAGQVPPPTGYVEKPVEPESFLDAVRSVLADQGAPDAGGGP
jgi:DNA-binding response OmpR family regulator